MADKEMMPAGDGLFWRGAEEGSLPTGGIETDIIIIIIIIYLSWNWATC